MLTGIETAVNSTSISIQNPHWHRVYLKLSSLFQAYVKAGIERPNVLWSLKPFWDQGWSKVWKVQTVL